MESEKFRSKEVGKRLKAELKFEKRVTEGRREKRENGDTFGF